MSGRETRLFFSFFVLMSLPSFIYVVVSSSSMSLGLILAFLLICPIIFYNFSVKVNRAYLVSLFLLFLVLYQIIIFGVGEYPVNFRTVASFIFLAFLIVAAFLFGGFVSSFNGEELTPIAKLIAFSFVALGLISLVFNQEFLGYEKYKKSIFPFSEPSHFAITVGPILFACGFFISKRMRFFLVLIFILFGMFFPSLVTLLFAMMMFLFFFQTSLSLKFFLCGIAVFLAYVFLSTNVFDYFISRLVFSTENQNLTALVYMQGWADASASLEHSRFLGVGFQNAGILPPGEIGNLIYSLAGEYKNRQDGGFLLAKIISEFGVFGIVLLIFYLFVFFKASLALSRFRKCNSFSEVSGSSVFFNAIVVGFSVELFARGYGYFSPGFFLLIASGFVLSGVYGDIRVKGVE